MSKRFIRLFFVLFFTLSWPINHSRAAEAVSFYVSTEGNNDWSGTSAEPGGDDGPFVTLERARDEIRARKRNGGLPEGGVTVYIREGVYILSETFALTADDSGDDAHPIVYAAYGDETPRIIGGVKLDASWFSPVSDPNTLARFDEKARPNILQADLRAHGVTDFGTLTPRGFGRPTQPAAMELFFNGRPMKLAQTPNKQWAKIASVPNGQMGDSFAMQGDSAKNWASLDDVWVHGYWTYDWADSYVKVKSIDTETRIITTEEPYGVYGYTARRRFQFVNVLEALDSPGEWYVDRKTGILYIWPPRPLETGELTASMLQTPIISITDASNITLRGLTIELTRGAGLTITGGKNNLVAGCTLRNTGNYAAVLKGGVNNGIQSSDIYGAGDGGILLDGGDRKSLTPAGLFSVNNDIHDFSRWSRTYTPGVMIRGVGNRIVHNRIHDAPHVGILLNGNDHLIEFNDIYNLNWETSDVGAFYLGRDWTERGNIVRYNFFHNINAVMNPDVLSGLGSHAVYLDDCAAGTTVFGNVFYKVDQGVFIGGGRDNIVENNIFVESGVSVLADARCLGWASATVVPGGTLNVRLLDMNYTQPPFSVRYPELLNILDDEPGAPKGNVIANNISLKSEFLKLQDIDQSVLALKNNLIDIDPLFIDAKNRNYQLQDDSSAYKTGFQRIPFEKIGLYLDTYRKSLPEE